MNKAQPVGFTACRLRNMVRGDSDTPPPPDLWQVVPRSAAFRSDGPGRAQSGQVRLRGQVRRRRALTRKSGTTDLSLCVLGSPLRLQTGPRLRGDNSFRFGARGVGRKAGLAVGACQGPIGCCCGGCPVSGRPIRCLWTRRARQRRRKRLQQRERAVWRRRLGATTLVFFARKT